MQCPHRRGRSNACVADTNTYALDVNVNVSKWVCRHRRTAHMMLHNTQHLLSDNLMIRDGDEMWMSGLVWRAAVSLQPQSQSQSPELSKPYMDMACKLFTVTFTMTTNAAECASSQATRGPLCAYIPLCAHAHTCTACILYWYVWEHVLRARYDAAWGQQSAHHLEQGRRIHFRGWVCRSVVGDERNAIR